MQTAAVAPSIDMAAAAGDVEADCTWIGTNFEATFGMWNIPVPHRDIHRLLCNFSVEAALVLSTAEEGLYKLTTHNMTMTVPFMNASVINTLMCPPRQYKTLCHLILQCGRGIPESADFESFSSSLQDLCCGLLGNWDGLPEFKEWGGGLDSGHGGHDEDTEPLDFEILSAAFLEYARENDLASNAIVLPAAPGFTTPNVSSEPAARRSAQSLPGTLLSSHMKRATLSHQCHKLHLLQNCLT